MLIRESVEKTKIIFHKTLENLKSLFFGGYQKLPKHPLLNPFSCSRRSHSNNNPGDQVYTGYCPQVEFDVDKTKKRKQSNVMGLEEPVIEEDACGGSFMQLVEQGPEKTKQEERVKEPKKLRASRSAKGEKQHNWITNRREPALARRMKELDMMDAGDLEHVLDVEEALHYYSRLKSPVYLDIVDKFFTDMYSEYSIPQASLSINPSKRRFGSIGF